MAKMMKSEGDGKHPSSHYLMVENPQEVTTWHLRVRNVGGKIDHTLMGAAWAALHGGYRGNKYEGPNKVQALAKLRKLYMSEGMPMPGSKKSIWYKDKKGDLWFIGVYSNNFADRHDEIISEKAHEEFVGWLKEKKIKPPIVFIHEPDYPDVFHAVHYLGLITGRITPDEFNDNLFKLYEKTAIAQTETVFMLNGFTFVVAKVFENKREIAHQLMERQESWGMSHGFIVAEKSANIINKYRSFEFSLLPHNWVANRGTPIIFKEGKMEELAELKALDEKDREILTDILGGNSEKTLEEKTALAQTIFSKILASKGDHMMEDMDEEEDEDEEEKVKSKSYEEIRAKIYEDLKVAELMGVLESVGKKLADQETLIKQQDEQIKTLAVQLKKTGDEIVADAFAPPVWMDKVFKQEIREGDEELAKKLKENAPPPPVEKKEFDKDNPLDLGLWANLVAPK
jgi:hypothetical protein